MRMTTMLAALAAVAFVSVPPPAAAAPKDEAQIKALVEQWRLAFQKKDVKGVMAIYAKDAFAYDIVPPLQYVGAAAYGKDYEEFFAAWDGPIAVEIKDMHVTAGDTVAYMACLEHLSGKMKDGSKTDLWLRATEVYRKAGGKWRAVHDHISVPADMATGKAALDLKP